MKKKLIYKLKYEKKKKGNLLKNMLTFSKSVTPFHYSMKFMPGYGPVRVVLLPRWLKLRAIGQVSSMFTVVSRPTALTAAALLLAIGHLGRLHILHDCIGCNNRELEIHYHCCKIFDYHSPLLRWVIYAPA